MILHHHQAADGRQADDGSSPPGGKWDSANVVAEVGRLVMMVTKGEKEKEVQTLERVSLPRHCEVGPLKGRHHVFPLPP